MFGYQDAHYNREEGLMKLYAAIDLHSNNLVLVILDSQDKVRLELRTIFERC